MWLFKICDRLQVLASSDIAEVYYLQAFTNLTSKSHFAEFTIKNWDIFIFKRINTLNIAALRTSSWNLIFHSTYQYSFYTAWKWTLSILTSQLEIFKANISFYILVHNRLSEYCLILRLVSKSKKQSNAKQNQLSAAELSSSNI